MMSTIRFKNISLQFKLIATILIYVFGSSFSDEAYAFQVKKDTLDYWNVQKFVINQKTSEGQLDEMISRLKKENVTLSFNNIVREDHNGYLKGLKIDYVSQKSSGTYTIEPSAQFKPIAIQYDVVGKTVSIGPNPVSNLSQTIQLEPQRLKIHKLMDSSQTTANVLPRKLKDGSDGRSITRDTIITTRASSIKTSDTLQVHTEVAANSVYIDQESNVFVIKKVNGKVVLNDSVVDGSGGNLKWFRNTEGNNDIMAVEDGDQIYFHKTKDKPLFVKDGTIYVNGVGKIDKNEIQAINVLKGHTAIAKYGDKGKNGVIEITTSADMSKKKTEVDVFESEPINHLDDSSSESDMILYITKEADDKELQKQREFLKKINVSIEYTKIQRDAVNYITRIRITLKDEKGNSVSSIFNDSYGIDDIYFGRDNKGLFVSHTH